MRRATLSSKFRIINFSYKKFNNCSGVVTRIERCPFRSANISLIKYENGAYGYVTTEENHQIGTVLKNTDEGFIIKGNGFILGNIPSGNQIFNIELVPNSGAKLCRSAGASAKIISHDLIKKLTKIKVKLLFAHLL